MGKCEATGTKKFGQPLGMMAALRQEKYRGNSCELLLIKLSEPCPKSMG